MSALRPAGAFLGLALCLAPLATGAVAGDLPADRSPDALPRRSFAEAFRTFTEDGRYLVTFPARTNRRGVWLTMAFVAGTGVALHFDDQVHRNMRDAGNRDVLRLANRFSALGTEWMEGLGLGAFYLSARAAGRPRDVATAATAFEAYLWTMGITVAAKAAFGRARPSSGADARDFFEGDTIFPSGHASRSFAIAAVLAHDHGRRAAAIAYPAAAAVGLATVRRNVHWTSDVVAGAGLGLAIGRALARRHACPLDAGLISGTGRAPGRGIAWSIAPARSGAAILIAY